MDHPRPSFTNTSDFSLLWRSHWKWIASGTLLFLAASFFMVRVPGLENDKAGPVTMITAWVRLPQTVGLDLRPGGRKEHFFANSQELEVALHDTEFLEELKEASPETGPKIEDAKLMTTMNRNGALGFGQLAIQGRFRADEATRAVEAVVSALNRYYAPAIAANRKLIRSYLDERQKAPGALSLPIAEELKELASRHDSFSQLAEKPLRTREAGPASPKKRLFAVRSAIVALSTIGGLCLMLFIAVLVESGRRRSRSA